jgi:hypothetical protein
MSKSEQHLMKISVMSKFLKIKQTKRVAQLLSYGKSLYKKLEDN